MHRYSISRRRVLASLAATTALSGCNGDSVLPDGDGRDDGGGGGDGDGDGDGSEEDSTAGFEALTDTLRSMRQLWEETATGAIEDMVDEMWSQTADLLETSISGGTLDRAKEIGESVELSVQLVQEGRVSFDRERYRNRAAIAEQQSDRVRTLYDRIGVQYEDQQPFVPLFDALVRDVERVVRVDDGTARDTLARHAGLLSTLLSSYLLSHVRQAVNRDHDPLFVSLRFLQASANDLQSLG